MKIRHKTTLSFLFLSMLPLLAMGAIAYINAERALREAVGESFHRLAHNTIAKIDQNIYYTYREVKVWSEFEVMQEVVTGDLDGKIASFLMGLDKERKLFSRIAVFNSKGDVIAENHPVLAGRNEAGEEFFREAMKGHPFISDAVFCPLCSSHVVVMAFPIRAGFDNKSIIGVFKAAWKVENLSMMIGVKGLREGIQIGDQGYVRIVILRHDGLVIAAPLEWKRSVYKENLIEKGFQSVILASRGQEGYLIEGNKGWGNLFVGYDRSEGSAEFPGLRWLILASADVKTIFEPVERLQYIILTMGSFVAIGVLMLSLFASRKITGPLSELISGARKVAAGNFTTMIHIHADEEVNQLADSFNQMTENLRRTTVSQEYVDSILSNMSSALVVLTDEGKIRTVNKALCDLLRYTPEELMGQPLEYLLTQEEIFRDNSIVTLTTRQSVENMELFYQRKDGRTVPVLFSSSMMRDGEGHLQGVICSAQDIGERKEAQEQSNRLATALQSVGDAVMITDIEGVIQYVNPSFERITGYGASEAVGRKPNLLRSGTHDEAFYSQMLETLHRGRIWSGLIVNKRKDGTLFDAEETIGIVRDTSYKIINYVAILRDVTERKKAQAEQTMLATALQAVGEAVLITGVDGVIQHVNPAFEKVTGYLSAEVIGKKPNILKSGMQDQVFYKFFWETILSGKTWNAVIVNKKKDGTLFTCEQIVAPVTDASGQIINFVGVLHDITKRQKMEEDLRRINDDLTREQKAVRALFEDLQRAHKDLADREKALREMFVDLQKTHDDLKQTQRQLLQSEKLASIGLLAAGVAHEINNPLGFISSNLQTLENYVEKYTALIRFMEDLRKAIKDKHWEAAVGILVKAKHLEEEMNLNFIKKDMEELLRESRDGIERIKKIVLDLRSFAREDEEVMEMVNIEEVIDNILNIVGNEIKYKADVEKDYGGVPFLKCNPRKIGQVFVNLLINAAQAIEGKGIIRIKTYQKDAQICVEVQDTGKGMDEQTIKRVFDPFFTTKPAGEGTGLGLSISYDIIKEHNGDIVVSSEAGKGTTFTVTLPFHSEQG